MTDKLIHTPEAVAARNALAASIRDFFPGSVLIESTAHGSHEAIVELPNSAGEIRVRSTPQGTEDISFRMEIWPAWTVMQALQQMGEGLPGRLAYLQETFGSARPTKRSTPDNRAPRW